MITGIDHLVVLCSSINEGRATYEMLLGRNADWQSHDPLTGISSVFFQLEGVAVELIAPHGNGTLTGKLTDRLHQQGPGLQSVVFSSDSLEEDRRIFERRALSPEEIQVGQSMDIATRRVRQWSRFRMAASQTAGVRMFVLQRSPDDPLTELSAIPGALVALDHLVVNTDHPDRAMALYGARLGLRLALDLTLAQRDIRLMSFKAGASRIEVSHRISGEKALEADKLWGVTWRTVDIVAAHARMQSHGLNISDIRTGMQKGTQVFTVRDGTCSVPTLILCESLPALQP
jgi:catechol 2,3-dioxygenase-like lactoylglutathione lyase family enzyme